MTGITLEDGKMGKATLEDDKMGYGTLEDGKLGNATLEDSMGFASLSSQTYLKCLQYSERQ